MAIIGRIICRHLKQVIVYVMCNKVCNIKLAAMFGILKCPLSLTLILQILINYQHFVCNLDYQQSNDHWCGNFCLVLIAIILTSFSLHFLVPKQNMYLYIGVLPPYQQIHEFVQQQQKEQVEHLLHTLKVINQLHETNDNFKDNVPMHIVQMYLLNEGEMGFMQPSEVLD